jgi:hypothetical protein
MEGNIGAASREAGKFYLIRSGSMEEKDKQKGRHKKKPSEGDEMAMRGISRPMAEQQIRKKQEEYRKEQEKEFHKQHKLPGEGEDLPEAFHQRMSREQQEEMSHLHQMQTLWVYWLLIILGIWLVMSPLTFSYGKSVVEPGGGRELWLSLENRITFMRWSDIVSGLLLIFFGWRSLTPGSFISRWVCCFIGVWLNMAPLIFWAPNATAYLNGTLVGTLVIALTILIPGVPDMVKIKNPGSEVPAGWSYNPSAWPQRGIMIMLSIIGWMVSRYMTAFQMGYIDEIWDPFFAEGSRLVLNSDISHSFPVSDGGLGSLAYTFEFLVLWMGGTARWRTLPWVVIFFGILVIPLSLAHLALIIAQPVFVNEWCTWCLLTAVFALPMIALEIDEVAATIQSSLLEKRIGKSSWDAFWKSGEPGRNKKDERSPALIAFPQKPGEIIKASVWGVSSPWTLVASIALGIWLMFAPPVLGISIDALAADISRVAASLILVIAVISLAEVVRLVRMLNVLHGLALAGILWFVEDSNLGLNICATLTGLLIAGLSIPRGPKNQTYGMWDKYVK